MRGPLRARASALVTEGAKGCNFMREVPLPARPTRLGPYEVIVKIAGGGMATIYLGSVREDRGRERLVALKVIRHELRRDERFVEMFLDEARVLSRLSHPNIAATYHFGRDEEHHFIAMELLVGRTLLELWDACKAKKLTLRLDHAAWMGARIADALHHAHEAVDEEGQPLHLVHRDVNPSNVFVTFEGEVKLFDFGLAKARGRQGKSVEGIVKGKLPYLSPEQIAQLPLDRRSDIYMLGTTLWEMTTMRRLFKRDDDVETLMLVRAGLVPDPRARIPNYPEELWSVVRHSLARDRDYRYATAAELARDLDAFVATQGGAEEMPLLTAAVLDALFPGEREARSDWLRRASAPRPEGSRATLPPPVPVVGASTGSMAPPPPTSSRPPPLRSPPAPSPAPAGHPVRGRKA
jgi:serine/threonine protein kinase